MLNRWSVGLLCGLVLLSSCDKRTAEEKGKQYADEKLGFVQGAAEVLEKNGKKLGQTVGKGVGEVVKGTGSGVKDVVHAPVSVSVAGELAGAGLKVLQAHEGEDSAAGRGVVVLLDFAKHFEGKLRLQALAAGGVEVGRAEPPESLNEPAGAQKSLVFAFASDVRLSKVESYVLRAGVSKLLAVDASVEKSGVILSQLKENGSEVSVYVQIEKAFEGGLQLRARTAEGAEVGRSEPSERIEREAQSGGYITFKFDARTPLSSVNQYTLYAVTPAKPKQP